MDHPVACRLLPHLLFDERVTVAEQLHGQFVVGRLEESNELVLQIVRRRRARLGRFDLDADRLVLRHAEQTRVVADKLHVRVVRQIQLLVVGFQIVLDEIIVPVVVGDVIEAVVVVVAVVVVLVHGDGDRRISGARVELRR